MKMQEKREGPRRFCQAVAPPQSIIPLKLVARDSAGGGPPSDYEGRDSAKIRVVLADSETIYREGIQKTFAIEDDIRVIARVDTLAGLHDAIQRFPTDLVLLEGRLILGAVYTISDLVRDVPKLKIIVQLSQKDQINTVELYRRGIRGIIPRSISADLLVKCVRRIAAGEIWIDNESIHSVIEAYQSQKDTQPSLRTQPRLSPKELAVITYVTQGMRNKEIALQLGTSEQVIKNYLRKIYDKLGVSDRLELALYWLNHQGPDKGP
jgi:two-component system, NarL family, nitrate/nitrite response regulator NarL